jgi:hypothetical protein
MGITDADKLDALISQCSSIDAKITSYHLLGAKVLALGTSIIPTILAISFKNNYDTVLLILPIAIFSVIFYWVNINTWIVSHGGYKRYIEEQINALTGEPIYFWEAGVVPSRHTNLSNVILNSIFSLVLILCISASLWASRKNGILFAAVAVLNLVLVISLVFSFAYLKTEFQRTYKDTKQFQSAKIANKKVNEDASL